MKTSDFHYELPPDRIAQTPANPRDSSKMMVYNRASGLIEHRIFRDLPDYLTAGDVLVINDTKVIPARLFGVKAVTKGFIEFLLLTRKEKDIWEVLVRPGRRATPGARFLFGDKLTAEVLEVLDGGQRLVRFYYDGIFENILDKLGVMPLPPYIREKLSDPERYQTVYAREPGSAAAPTAGLHFTSEMLDKIRANGIEIVPVTLHVGLGTFRPVTDEDIHAHKMHSEFYTVTLESAERINRARESGGRIISVGTTSARVLETVSDEQGKVRAASGWTD